MKRFHFLAVIPKTGKQSRIRARGHTRGDAFLLAHWRASLLARKFQRPVYLVADDKKKAAGRRVGVWVNPAA